MIGDLPLSYLLRLPANDMEYLISHLKDGLNEDLTAANRDSLLRFSSTAVKPEDFEMIAKQTLKHLSEPENVDRLKRRKKRVQEKARKIGIYRGDVWEPLRASLIRQDQRWKRKLTSGDHEEGGSGSGSRLPEKGLPRTSAQA